MNYWCDEYTTIDRQNTRSIFTNGNVKRGQTLKLWRMSSDYQEEPVNHLQIYDWWVILTEKR